LHLAGKQRAKDIRREGDLRAVGLEYVTMVSADLRDQSGFKAPSPTTGGCYSQVTLVG